MNYGEVKDYFRKILNRRDITDALTNTFIANAIQRIQRVVRLPPMEKTAAIASSDGSLALPSDLLQVIAVVSDNKVYGRISLHDVYTYREDGSSFCGFTQRNGELLVTPLPGSSTTYEIDYYADATGLVADTDTNWLTEVAPDALAYGALSYAADYFLDSRKDMFEGRFTQAVAEIAEQRLNDELSGGASIQPAYSMNF